ncbi:MAG: family 16 glycoside hydrolase [Chloroflexota bacterium]
MRRILLLVVLVIIFAVLLVLSRSVASWQHSIVSAAPDTLIYAATFDGESTDGFNPDWTQYTGRLSAQIDSGSLRVEIGDIGGGAYSVAAPHFGDFDLRADAQTTAGPLDNAYGIVFRLQNKDNATFEDDSYYLFLISADGYYRVMRVIDGGSPEIISDWIASPSVNQGLGVVNRLRVVARGDQFNFTINDQPAPLCIPDDPAAHSTINPLDGSCMGGAMLDTLTDSTIPNGQIGVSALWMAGADEDPVAATFDNLLIYAPEGE